MTEFLPPPRVVDWVETERSPAGCNVVGLDVLGKVTELVVLHVDGDLHEDIFLSTWRRSGLGLEAWREETEK
eukprot:scaffold5664_cov115-Isochrysis_galbana.AAC.3